MIELRDLFAAVAMHAFITQTNDQRSARKCIDDPRMASVWAYGLADEMIDIREANDANGPP